MLPLTALLDEGIDMRRHRNVKIVATLGPASNDYAMIRALHEPPIDYEALEAAARK